jgi:hypothetical protein
LSAHLGDRDVRLDYDSVVGVQLVEHHAQRVTECAVKGRRCRFEHRYLATQVAGARGEFSADESATDDGDRSACDKMRPDDKGIVESA